MDKWDVVCTEYEHNQSTSYKLKYKGESVILYNEYTVIKTIEKYSCYSLVNIWNKIICGGRGNFELEII